MVKEKYICRKMCIFLSFIVKEKKNKSRAFLSWIDLRIWPRRYGFILHFKRLKWNVNTCAVCLNSFLFIFKTQSVTGIWIILRCINCCLNFFFLHCSHKLKCQLGTARNLVLIPGNPEILLSRGKIETFLFARSYLSSSLQLTDCQAEAVWEKSAFVAPTLYLIIVTTIKQLCTLLSSQLSTCWLSEWENLTPGRGNRLLCLKFLFCCWKLSSIKVH